MPPYPAKRQSTRSWKGPRLAGPPNALFFGVVLTISLATGTSRVYLLMINAYGVRGESEVACQIRFELKRITQN